jgi:tetratricopeptide (TPR) repeat protein
MSLQDILRRRQRADFVGRDERLTEFGANLRLPPGDLDRKFLFNIHGVAGVGKTFLTEQFRRVAERAGVVCAYADESSFDVLETMSALAADLAGQDRALTGFDKRLATYRERRHELEADPGAPGGGFITRSAVRVGLAAAREVPLLGMAADTVDAAAAAEQVDRLRVYLAKKFRSSDDVRLLLSPAEMLTKVFLADLDKLTERHPVTLFFDTFEQTGSYLEGWLLDVLAGRHGSIRANVMLTVAGQRPLDSNRWAPYRGVAADIPLEPFTEAEARELLAAKGVRDEETVQSILALSGRLPIWLATLADRPKAAREGGADPSDSAVERFLKWEPDEQRQAVALSGALPRRLNQDVLAVVGPGDLFDWLRRLPFVTEAAGHWRYHDVARSPMLRLYRIRSPQRWREQHRRLVAYYRTERDALSVPENQRWADATWQELLLEECYHALCADPAATVPTVLTHSLEANGVTNARRWAATLLAAGIDTDAEAVADWGRRLMATVPDDESDHVGFLTVLIERGNLPPESLKEAYRQRGRAHRLGTRYDAALADFDRALRLDPDFAWAVAGRGETYRLTQRWDEALADFDRAAELEPDDAWNLGSRGLVHRALGRLDDSLRDFDRAVEAEPDDMWVVMNRGETYRLMDRNDEALADFNRAIELHPDHAWAIGSRGQTYAAMGRHDEAMADLDRAVDLDSSLNWVLAARGRFLWDRGRYREAVAAFDRAVEADPQNYTSIMLRGASYRQLYRYPEAIADFDRATELRPDHDWAFTNRGEVLAAMGRRDAAIVDLTRAIDLAADPHALRTRGQSYADIGRADEALADFDRAVELDPTSIMGLVSRGTHLASMGHHDRSRADFDRAAELAPDDDFVFAGRGKASLSAGHVDDAVADFRRAVAVDPADGWNVFLLGTAHLTAGRGDQAASDFRRAVELGQRQVTADPESPSRRLNLAVYHAALGDWATATRLIRETTVPTQEFITEVLDDLANLAALPGVDQVRVEELLVVAREAQVHPSV